jgi:hypothetical protein
MSIDLELGIKIGAFIISLLILIKGIYEYTIAQKWKKAEFLSKEIKEFFNDFEIKRALILLDWNENEIPLKPNEMEGKTILKIDDNLIISSLFTHKQREKSEKENILLKGIFDVFFDRLNMFENYIEAGLIKTKDLKPYLIYWINILADPMNERKKKEVRAQIWKYIDEYGYHELRKLCRRFGFKHKLY